MTLSLSLVCASPCGDGANDRLTNGARLNSQWCLRMPIRQTKADWERQQAIRRRLVRAWGTPIHWYPKNENIDGYRESGHRIDAMLELKTHPHAFTSCNDSLVGLHKTINLCNVALAMSVDAVVVVGFTDGLFWIDATFIDFGSHCIINRRDRGADQDRSCLRIRNEQLIRIIEAPRATASNGGYHGLDQGTAGAFGRAY